jgi:hypothetical protein
LKYVGNHRRSDGKVGSPQAARRNSTGWSAPASLAETVR